MAMSAQVFDVALQWFLGETAAVDDPIERMTVFKSFGAGAFRVARRPGTPERERVLHWVRDALQEHVRKESEELRDSVLLLADMKNRWPGLCRVGMRQCNEQLLTWHPSDWFFLLAVRTHGSSTDVGRARDEAIDIMEELRAIEVQSRYFGNFLGYVGKRLPQGMFSSFLTNLTLD